MSSSPSRGGISSVPAASCHPQGHHLHRYQDQVWSSYTSCERVSGMFQTGAGRQEHSFLEQDGPEPSQTCCVCQSLSFAWRSQWWNGQGMSPGDSLLPCSPLLSCLFRTWAFIILSHVCCPAICACDNEAWDCHQSVRHKHLSCFFSPRCPSRFYSGFLNFLFSLPVSFSPSSSENSKPSLVTDTNIFPSNAFSCWIQCSPIG